MENLENGLGSVIRDLTPDNYEKSLELYRFRFELGDTYSHTSPNLIFDTIWKYQPYAPPADGLTCPNSSLIFRFATDAESDKVLGPHCGGLRQRLCKEILLRFFGHALQSDHSYCNRRYCSQTFLLHANQIAHAANLGYIEEGKICGHILPSLMSYSESGDCKAKVVTILFKIAGPTFEACADPSVVESCFEFLRSWKPKEAPNSRLQQQIKEVVRLRDPKRLQAKLKATGGGQEESSTALVQRPNFAPTSGSNISPHFLRRLFVKKMKK